MHIWEQLLLYSLFLFYNRQVSVLSSPADTVGNFSPMGRSSLSEDGVRVNNVPPVNNVPQDIIHGE